MKKFFAMLVAGACTLGAMATVYTGQLTTSLINYSAITEFVDSAEITLDFPTDSTIRIYIPDIKLNVYNNGILETTWYYGDLTVDTVFQTQSSSSTSKTLTLTTNALLTESSVVHNDGVWIGQYLGTSVFSLFVTINDFNVHLHSNMVFGKFDESDWMMDWRTELNFNTYYKRGDMNGDGHVDISDVNAVIHEMLNN